MAMSIVTTWGARGRGTGIGPEIRVRVGQDRSGLDAAVARIERDARLAVCCVSPQGTSLDGQGHPESRHYELTLGRALPRRLGGGYSVEGSLWIAVPVGTGLGHVGYRG